MKGLIDFFSSLTGIFILFLAVGFSLDVNGDSPDVPILSLTLFILGLLMMQGPRAWFLDNTGVRPHRGLLLLLLLLAFGYGPTSSFDSDRVDPAYERELSAYKQALLAYEQTLLDELKTIPTAKFRENLVRYEVLVELSPSNQKYIDKVAFYAAKIEGSIVPRDVPILSAYHNKVRAELKYERDRELSECQRERELSECQREQELSGYRREREMSARQQALLAQLKTIPPFNYRERLIRYEELAALRPFNLNYPDKVAFYAAKIEESTGQNNVSTFRPNIPKKPKPPKPPKQTLGVFSYLCLFMFGWVFMKLISHSGRSSIKDKVVLKGAEVNLRDDEPPKANEQEVDGFALPKEFIVFDLETTGLSPHDCEIIEIGAIKVNRDSGEHITFQALVKPSSPIPSKITHMTGITQKMIKKDGENIKTVIPEFLDFIGDLRLVAYNARFDMGFIRAATAKQGLKIKNPHSCALKMARRAWPDLESYKLVDVAERGGLSAKGNHRALKDAELTMTVYAAAAETLESLS